MLGNSLSYPRQTDLGDTRGSRECTGRPRNAQTTTELRAALKSAAEQLKVPERNDALNKNGGGSTSGTGKSHCGLTARSMRINRIFSPVRMFAGHPGIPVKGQGGRKRPEYTRATRGKRETAKEALPDAFPNEKWRKRDFRSLCKTFSTPWTPIGGAKRYCANRVPRAAPARPT